MMKALSLSFFVAHITILTITLTTASAFVAVNHHYHPHRVLAAASAGAKRITLPQQQQQQRRYSSFKNHATLLSSNKKNENNKLVLFMSDPQQQPQDQQQQQQKQLPFWLDIGTKGGALFWSLVLFLVPIVVYNVATSPLFGADEIQAGIIIGVGFTVLSTVAWVSTYIFRVATKDMTYVRT